MIILFNNHIWCMRMIWLIITDKQGLNFLIIILQMRENPKENLNQTMILTQLGIKFYTFEVDKFSIVALEWDLTCLLNFCFTSLLGSGSYMNAGPHYLIMAAQWQRGMVSVFSANEHWSRIVWISWVFVYFEAVFVGRQFNK